MTGASRGIGYHVARNFACGKESTVLALSRNEEGLKALEQECLVTCPGSNIIILPYDLENLEGIGSELPGLVGRHFGSVDILVNNAGLLIKKPVMEMDPADAVRMMTVNFLVPMLLVRSLMPLLEKASHAHVVSIGSMAGVQGARKFPGLSAYSASKAAVHVLTECLAAEFGNGTIRFNTLALGSVRTEMLAEAFPGLEAPLEPSEMAGFIVDFARDGWKYFNGKTLPVAVSTP